MLLHKIAFCAASLVALLALALIAPHALAGDFKTELSIEDVSFADKGFDGHYNKVYHHDIQSEFDVNTRVYVKFDKVVDYRGGRPQDLAGENFDAFKDTGVFTHHDVVVLIYNEIGQVFATRTGADSVVIEPRDPNRHDGQNYTITFNTRDPAPRIEDHSRVLVYIKQGSVTAVDPAVAEADSKNAEGSVAFDLVYSDGNEAQANRKVSPTDPNTVRFQSPGVYEISTTDLRARAGVIEPFEVKIRLSEHPKTFTTDHINVVEGKATEVVFLRSFNIYDVDPTAEYYVPTGRGPGHLHYEYLVRIEPKFENKNDIVIKVKEFEDLVKPNRKYDPDAPHKYTPPTSENDYVEGFDKLTVKVGKEDLKAKVAGLKVGLPKEKHIPAGGYLVVADDKEGSSIHWSEADIKDAPKAHQRTPAELKYNTIALGLPNLETFLANGGVIGVMGPHALMITEIMWGSDASLADPDKSQWIELYNSGSGYQTQDGDNTTYLIFYGPGEAPATGLHDVVGTVDDTAGYWSLAGKGQSGRTAEKVAGEAVQQVATTPLISMQRVMDATGVLAKGTLATSWVQSTPPSLNFEANRLGVHVGTPGAKPVTFPEPPAPTPEPAPAPVIPVAEAADIMITEIMVGTGNGRLPQWIELTNVSGAEKSLAGWSLMITNSDADADVIGATVSINLSGTLGVGGGMDAGGTMGKALLLVGGTARSSSNLSGSDRVVDISSQVGERGRYAFISTMAFEAALIPPQATGVLTPGDTAGNLNAAVAWDLPMSENGRSSLIRREMLDDGMATMGTAANGWILASSTSLVSGPATWYGSDEDAGTPGYDAGGPLPVELSHFRPARDKQTGAVVITWATQSELNNAGFFIKRSQQRDGEFQVINATMVEGAGTTSEKQFYTYTDTTAQPNVVYYYQIEDVSLDGNRQTLTRGIRLKGHIGAAGKLTTTWGELKERE